MSREFVLDNRKFPRLKSRLKGACQFWGGDDRRSSVQVSLTNLDSDKPGYWQPEFVRVNRQEARELAKFLLEFANGREAEGF